MCDAPPPPRARTHALGAGAPPLEHGSLPFVFDALASLIVGNQDNGRKLSEAGAIAAVLGLMEEHMAQVGGTWR